MISRRDLLKMLAALGVGSSALSGYAVAEAFQENVTRYRLTPPRWTPGLKLRLAVLADLHVCEPWMSIERLRGHRRGDEQTGCRCDPSARRLRRRSQPRKVFDAGERRYLGDGSWQAQSTARRPCRSRQSRLVGRGQSCSGGARARLAPDLALQAVGIAVYENNVMRLEKDGQAILDCGPRRPVGLLAEATTSTTNSCDAAKSIIIGVDDLPGTLKQVTDDAPVILMAHEPDIFPKVPGPRFADACGPHARRPSSHFWLCAGRAVAFRQPLCLWAQGRRRSPSDRFRRPRVLVVADPVRRSSRNRRRRSRQWR